MKQSLSTHAHTRFHSMRACVCVCFFCVLPPPPTLRIVENINKQTADWWRQRRQPSSTGMRPPHTHTFRCKFIRSLCVGCLHECMCVCVCITWWRSDVYWLVSYQKLHICTYLWWRRVRGAAAGRGDAHFSAFSVCLFVCYN